MSNSPQPLWPTVRQRLIRSLLDLEHIQRDLHISYRRLRADELSPIEREVVRAAMVHEGKLHQQVMELLALKDPQPKDDTHSRPMVVGKVAV